MPSYHVLDESPPNCPKTWDGFACFQETPAGHDAQVTCPTYIELRDDDGTARKVCTENGTWWRDPHKGQEWTDYTGCVALEHFRTLYYVGMSCNALSLLCLVPSCIIFLSFKQLRKQHRIRIHLNLFFSFILKNSVWLGWDHMIFNDRLNNKDNAVMHANAELCRVLYVISRYSWTCNFVWMSLEGFHLYRLINHAFNAPKSILIYYYIGWLFPCIPICLYSIVRVSKLNTGCWVYHAGHLEWIMYGPNLFCIMVNVAFLINILRILLTQIQSHPNEPSNYRRALKATFILVPLFGLQLLVIVYKPSKDIVSHFIYEIMAKIIADSQGAVVALVCCFLNSEVHSQLRARFAMGRTQNSNNDIRSCTFSTDVRRISGRGSNARLEHIPLNCGSCKHTHSNGNTFDTLIIPHAVTVKWKPTGGDRDSNKGQMV